MSQFVIETRIKKGHLELDNVPFSDEAEVKVVIVPKVDISKMSFPEVQRLTGLIKGNLSEDADAERNSCGLFHCL